MKITLDRSTTLAMQEALERAFEQAADNPDAGLDEFVTEMLFDFFAPADVEEVCRRYEDGFSELLTHAVNGWGGADLAALLHSIAFELGGIDIELVVEDGSLAARPDGLAHTNEHDD